MATVLIVYGSKQGQAEKIAYAIGEEVRKVGHSCTIYNADKLNAQLTLSGFDAVIVGSGVHSGSFSKPLEKWIKKNIQTLSGMPSAFFSVCLGILQNDPKVQEDEHKIVQKFFKKTGWVPTTFTIFAGALTYSKYNWFLKRVMRNISKRAGADTDMTKDYEYTNWKDVSVFAHDFGSKLLANKRQNKLESLAN